MTATELLREARELLASNARSARERYDGHGVSYNLILNTEQQVSRIDAFLSQPEPMSAEEVREACAREAERQENYQGVMIVRLHWQIAKAIRALDLSRKEK